MPFDKTTPHLDLLLLGAATELELSERDRRVAEKRYRLAKEHLEREDSPLAAHLPDDGAIIYAQGSRAIGATIVSGTDEDRFDLDAILEFSVPADWTPKVTLDKTFEALQGFPDAVGVERCTRCVQVQFAFMHLDITPMSPDLAPRVPRTGRIFHCTDTDGVGTTAPSNPYGFAEWFRQQVGEAPPSYADVLKDLRAGQRDRFLETRAATQEDLPPIAHGRLDAPQVIALKLMKRFLNLRYADRAAKRPPSVYLSKKAAEKPIHAEGICAQLEDLAGYLRAQMTMVLDQARPLDERNPRHPAESFTDRWPGSREDVRLFARDLDHLLRKLQEARHGSFKEIGRIFEELFGETVGRETVRKYADRSSGRSASPAYVKGAGVSLLGSATTAPATAKSASVARPHHFHAGFGDRRGRKT